MALGGGVGTHVRRRGLGGIWKRVEGTCLALANSWGGLSLLRPTLLLGERYRTELERMVHDTGGSGLV